MFVFDIESLGTSERSVILSAAAVWVDTDATPQSILENSCFVKFNVKEQIEVYKRTHDASTLDWWKTQSEFCKLRSLKPSNADVTAAEGLATLTKYVKEKDPTGKATVWTRGSLDQFAIDSLSLDVGVDFIWEYYRYRDVRTAVDCFTGSTNGYCHIAFPGWNMNDYAKHDPVNDCLIDAMMLLYGDAP